MSTESSMNDLIALCKRKGFIFQSSEIYGGLNGFWDLGPLGVELKRNLRDLWWKDIVDLREDVVGLDSSIIMHPDIWKASGHVENFHDLMVDCKNCKKRFRLDHLEGKTCPDCGGEFTEPKQFDLMFKTFVGVAEESGAVAYLRPETAQSIFAQFKNVLSCSRMKVPFGIAQIGKSFRNEITPRNFIFRSREFEQMELEYFVREAERDRWFEYWVDARYTWYHRIGVRKEKLRLREHRADELAHYARKCTDVEYEFPFGWKELEGIADRGNFDLTQHIEAAGKDLSYFDEPTKDKFVPHVIETSAGLDRTLLTVLADAYHVEALEKETRTVLRLSPLVAPVQIAVFPLVKKLNEPTRKLENGLRRAYKTFFDSGGSIGRRYRRQDEVGTPYCVTFDFDSLEDQAVTVRDRDSMAQDRIAIDALADYFTRKFVFSTDGAG
jgi:glycyl-tRNA synthetase